jgi:hypothetical protein
LLNKFNNEVASLNIFSLFIRENAHCFIFSRTARKDGQRYISVTFVGPPPPPYSYIDLVVKIVIIFPQS